MKKTITRITMVAFAACGLLSSVAHAESKAVAKAPAVSVAKAETKTETSSPSTETPAVKAEVSTDAPKAAGEWSAAWGTRGGTTLGSGDAIKTMFGGGLNGLGALGVEAQFLTALAKDLDLGIGVRAAFVPNAAFAPTVQGRYRLVNSGRFQLALDVAVSIPFTFYMASSTRTSAAVVIEPGVMMSTWLKQGHELYYGLVFLSNLGWDFNRFGVGYTLGFNARLGYAYTAPNGFGMSLQADLIPLVDFTQSGIGQIYGDFAFLASAGVHYKF